MLCRVAAMCVCGVCLTVVFFSAPSPVLLHNANNLDVDHSVELNETKYPLKSSLKPTENNTGNVPSIDMHTNSALGTLSEPARHSEEHLPELVEKTLKSSDRVASHFPANKTSISKDQGVPETRELCNKQRTKLAKELSGYIPHHSLEVENVLDLIPEHGGRPVRNIVITTWRSGSTFLGDVLLSHPGTYYHYEPLLDFDINQVRSGERAERAVKNLDHLMRCNYTDMKHYLDYGVQHLFLHMHNSRLWWVCTAFKRYCSSPEFLSRFCKLFPFQAMKVVRLRLNLTEKFFRDDELDVRVVLLVRDPRATMQSRRHRDWCPNNDDCINPQRLCEDLESDYHAARRLDRLFPGKLRVIRYEDLSFNIQNMTRELFDFFRLSYVKPVEKFLSSHTKTKIGDVSSTFRNSKQAPIHWKTDLTFKQVEVIQSKCEHAMSLYGYKTARVPEQLADLDATEKFSFPYT